VIYRLYRHRIEALSRDAKGYFRPEECQVQTGARLSTLSLALWWLALVVPSSPQWHSQVRLRGRLSWLRQALEWLQPMILAPDCAAVHHPEMVYDVQARKTYGHPRHMGGSNVGFADGHAKWFSSEAIMSGSTDNR
jgi:prepilin-type processing-associated H-X9-DG protein